MPDNQVIPPATGSLNFKPGIPASFSPMWPSERMTTPPQPKPAQTEPEAKAQPAAELKQAAPVEKPTQEPTKPTESKQDKQDDDDLWDLLPKGW